MRFIYEQWDGTEFPTQDHLESFGTFMEYLIEYGDEALEALKQVELDPEQREMLEEWIKEGLLEKVGARFKLTPRAINALQRKALMEVFRDLKPDSVEGHETMHVGPGGERTEGTKPFAFGDPVSDVDLMQTLRNALTRRGQGSGVPSRGTPIRICEEDFEVYQTESNATCSTVILLDMSGSMSRWRRFSSAKRCAMAVYALIRQRFTLDTVDVVGFHTGAEVIPEHRLALVNPKQITMFDPQVRIRVPIAQIEQAPAHFTNLHMGLRLARQILAQRPGRNKQVFIITDGQPTAHLQGDYVYLRYPPDESSALATLREAMLLARQDIRFSTFALIEDYYYMDWIGFVDQLTKLTRGVAFYCTSGNLTSAIMESYLTGRRRKAYLA